MNENSSGEIDWFCLKSQPKHEHIAAAHLRRIPGLEVFSPRLRFQRNTVRGVIWFVEAMFPGYLFARFNLDQRFREVRSTTGVSSILKFGQFYAKLDPLVIDALRERTNAEQVVVIESTLKPGDVVTIVEGSLRGLSAVVTQILSGRERVRILLDFLGRQIHAEVGKPAVLPAKRHPLAE